MEKRIQADMVAAMKAKETVKLASLRAIKAAIMLAKTAEGATGEVTDADVIKIIQKLVKQRKESAQQYNDAGRFDLAANELAEADIMGVYLPKQLSEIELEVELAKIIVEVGATKSQDMGKVMGVATKRLAGLADGGAPYLLDGCLAQGVGLAGVVDGLLNQYNDVGNVLNMQFFHHGMSLPFLYYHTHRRKTIEKNGRITSTCHCIQLTTCHCEPFQRRGNLKRDTFDYATKLLRSV